MSIESWTASLHAGLIQRTRPVAPDPVAPGEGTMASAIVRSRLSPLRERERFGRAPATPFRESAIARARGILGRSPETDDLPMPERVPRVVPDCAPECAPERSAEAPLRHGWSFRRRFGLTVRVHAAMRELLFDARLRTGRTTQSILHDALVQYLDSLDRKPGQR